MVEHSKDPPHEEVDGAIAGKFAHMRATESATAPPFPAGCVPLTEKQSFGGKWLSRQALPRVAAALAVLAITAALLSNRPAEDPAAVYASIISEHHMQTDPLLNVSYSVLPAMRDLPSLYRIDVGFVSETDPD